MFEIKKCVKYIKLNIKTASRIIYMNRLILKLAIFPECTAVGVRSCVRITFFPLLLSQQTELIRLSHQAAATVVTPELANCLT